MPKLKTLSGTDLIRIFSQFGFTKIAQEGSHIKLRRIVDGRRQSLTVPLHRELDRGTLHAIFRQALRYISFEHLSPFFYSE